MFDLVHQISAFDDLEQFYTKHQRIPPTTWLDLHLKRVKTFEHVDRPLIIDYTRSAMIGIGFGLVPTGN